MRKCIRIKLFLKIILGIFIAFVLVAGGGTFYITRGLESGSKVAIHDIGLSTLKDGSYNGKYKAGRWTNEVNVTIENHAITKIELVKDVMIPQPDLKYKIFNEVVESQSLSIDVISGATVTSKAYLKSIENALKE